MTLETITKAQLANDLGLLDSCDQVSEHSVANLLRAPLNRWGLSPKRSILKHVRDQLRAGGVDDVGCVPTVLGRLVTLGECAEVRVGNEVYIVPAEPRWLRVGRGVGAYLGASDLPKGVYRLPTASHSDIVQSICVAVDEDAVRLEMAGVREVSIGEWLSPFDYLRYASRRMRRPLKSDSFTLISFWEMLETTLAEEGLSLSADAELRAVTGNPGKYFGRHDATQLEGRWTAVLPDGVWCGFRRGYSDVHWHPTIISVDGQDRRSLDLYDQDEWRWALLARGKRFVSEEVVISEPGRVRLTFPPPKQLAAAMDLLGESTQSWVWDVAPDAPDVWGLIQ